MTQTPFFFLRGVTLGGSAKNIVCLNPQDVKTALELENKDSSIIKDANSIKLKSGKTPSVATLLITKKDFDALVYGYRNFENSNINRGYITLFINYNFRFTTALLGITRLSVVSAFTVLGDSSDPNSVILVKLKDNRYWLDRIATNVADTDAYQYQHNFIASTKTSSTGNEEDSYYQYIQRAGTFTDEYDLIDSKTILRRLCSYIAFQNSKFPLSVADSHRFNPTLLGDLIAVDNELENDILHNVEFTNSTALESLCNICESLRLNIVPDSNVRSSLIITDKEAEWPDTSDAIHESTDLGDFSTPSAIKVLAVKEDYFRRNYDTVNSSISSSTLYHSYDYAVPVDERQLGIVLSITTAYLYARSGVVNNLTEIDQQLERIAKRFLKIIKQGYRSVTWTGFKKFTMGFGLDEVIYQQNETGFTTTAVSRGVEDLSLNYLNPKFKGFTKLPMPIWLYEFSDSKPLPGEFQATVENISQSFYPKIDVDNSVGLLDPAFIFTDIGYPNYEGLCIDQPTYPGSSNYYIIQAPCGE